MSWDSLFAFADQPVWHSAQAPALRITNESLAADGSLLTASVVNDTQGDVRSVTVTAVLFDADGVAVVVDKGVFEVDDVGIAADRAIFDVLLLAAAGWV